MLQRGQSNTQRHCQQALREQSGVARSEADRAMERFEGRRVERRGSEVVGHARAELDRDLGVDRE